MKKEKSSHKSPIKVDSQGVVTITVSDDDVLDPAPSDSSTPRSARPQSRRCHMEDQAPEPSPSLKQVGEEQLIPQCEALLPTGVVEKDLLLKRYETFTLDYDWVHIVRASLLGMEADTIPSEEDINASPHFIPQTAALEVGQPEIVTSHWLPIL